MRRIKLFIAVLLAVLIAVGIDMPAFADDTAFLDYCTTYSSLSSREKKEMYQYTGQASTGNNSFIYYTFHTEQRDIGLPTKSEKDGKVIYSYFHQIARAKRFFVDVRDDINYFNTFAGGGWDVDSIEYDDEGEYAVVSYYGRATNLNVPTRIIKDGHTYPVRGINISSGYLRRINLKNNIKYIYKLNAPMLQWITGYDAVTFIGNSAFENCILLKKFPLMENLAYIGSRAFWGCLSLKEIPLGNNLEMIYPDSIGWYDVVLGNYDFETAIGDEINYYEGFRDNERIYGINVYMDDQVWQHLYLYDLYELGIYADHFEEVNGEFVGDYYDQNYVRFVADHVNLRAMSEFGGVAEEEYRKEDEYTVLPSSKAVENTINSFLGEIVSEGSEKKPEKDIVIPISPEKTEPAKTETNKGELTVIEKNFIEEVLALFSEGDAAGIVLIALMMVFSGAQVPSELAPYLGASLTKKFNDLGKQYESLTPAERKAKEDAVKTFVKSAITVGEKAKAIVRKCEIGKLLDDTIKSFELISKGTPPLEAVSKSTGIILVSAAVESNPTVLGWDLLVASVFRGDGKDALNIGANVEHVMELIIDVAGNSGNQKAMEKINDAALNGDYGENMKQFMKTLFMVTSKESREDYLNQLAEAGPVKVMEHFLGYMQKNGYDTFLGGPKVYDILKKVGLNPNPSGTIKINL